jgi:hypothetical protein
MTDIEYGPKMLACSERERQFVINYLSNGGNAAQAARDSGVPDKGGIYAKVEAFRIMHRERVLDALEEVGRKEFRGLLMPAIIAMRALLERPDHPDHARTAQTVLSRLGFAERTGVDVKVSGEVQLNHTDAAVEQLRILRDMGVPREKLVETFGFSGLSRYERMLEEMDRRSGPALAGGAGPREMKVIEHDAKDITGDSGGGVG